MDIYSTNNMMISGHSIGHWPIWYTLNLVRVKVTMNIHSPLNTEERPQLSDELALELP